MALPVPSEESGGRPARGDQKCLKGSEMLKLMRHGRRATLVTLSAALLGLALPIASAKAQTVELRFLHYMDETGNRETLRRLLNRFETENPGIKVAEFATPTEQVVPDAQAAAAARRPYDVAQVLARVVIGARAVTNARPFTEAPDKGAFLENFAPNLRELGKVDGKYYLAPHSLGTPLLYYNMDIMEKAGLDPTKPPRTLQELQVMARQVKAKTDANGVYFTTGGLDLGPQQLIRLAGSAYLDGNKAVFDTPEGIAAMQFWQDLVREGLHPKVNDRDAATIFGAGKLAFNLTTSARLAGTVKSAQGKFRLGVATVPAWEGKPAQVPNSGSGLMVTAQRPDRIAASFKLVAFLSQPEITNLWSRSTGYLPLAKDPLAEPAMRAFIEQNPHYRVLVDQMAATVPTALWPGDRVVEGQTVVGNLITDLWDGNKGSAADLVPKAAREVSRILKESTAN